MLVNFYYNSGTREYIIRYIIRYPHLIKLPTTIGEKLKYSKKQEEYSKRIVEYSRKINRLQLSEEEIKNVIKWKVKG